MKTEKTPRISVGVDLHKQQFTVNALNEESGEIYLKKYIEQQEKGTKNFAKRCMNTKKK